MNDEDAKTQRREKLVINFDTVLLKDRVQRVLNLHLKKP